MSMAPPGIQTGTFYIILGNIPKKKRGNELKSFVQQSGYSVVDAHIHQNLGCGYVSVRGPEAFFQLGKWLETVVWEGKTLQVDLRNYDHGTALGPGSHPSLGSPIERLGPSNRSPTSPNGNGIDHVTPQVQYAQYQPQAPVTVSPAYVTVQSGFAQQYTYANTPMTYPAAPTMQAPTYDTNHTSLVITSPYQYAAPSQFQSAPAPSQQQVPMSYSQSSYPTANPPATMQLPAAQVRPARQATVSISNRLVYCTRVQGCDSKGEIRRKVLSVLPAKEDNPIEHLWIPTRPHDGSERGHALILMSSEELADGVVAKLNGVKVRGKDNTKRPIRVKIAKEGISDDELAALNVGNGGNALAGQMKNMSLSTAAVAGSISEDGTEESGQSFNSSTAMSKTASNEPAPKMAAENVEIPGTGRRRSSLPVVNGSFPQSMTKSASEKVERESKSSKDKEKSSRHGHHGSSHHSSSSKTSVLSGSRKSRK